MSFFNFTYMNTDLMFSSQTDLWYTPQDFFDKYDSIHGFTTDVCALPSNTKCMHYFTPEDDGLKQKWKGVCWMNPPYGREIGKWVKKAHDEVISQNAKTIVCLLPARTDTKWFHDYIYGKSKIEFIKGRLKFGGSKDNAPFPSMVVTFGLLNNQ